MTRHLTRLFSATAVASLTLAAVVAGPAGVLVPAGAQASTGAGQLTSGKPVKATISEPGQQVEYTFAATANMNVTFNVTHFKFTDSQGAAQVTLNFYEPGSSSAYTQCNFTKRGYCNFTAPESGTWTVALVPYAATVGSLTLTFAHDVRTVTLPLNHHVTTTIKYWGQQAGYTFATKAYKYYIKITVTAFNLTNYQGQAQFTLNFYEPGSSTVDAYCTFVRTTTSCLFKPRVSGTWSVTLVPAKATVGSVTLERTH